MPRASAASTRKFARFVRLLQAWKLLKSDQHSEYLQINAEGGTDWVLEVVRVGDSALLENIGKFQ